jgi:protocatechuate 3,4-dioxygenase beta subunit
MRIGTIIFCASAAALLWAQEPAATPAATIEGRIVNQVTSEPVRRAKVTLSRSDGQNARQGVLTDSEGRFLFDNVPPGTYLLWAERPGFLRQDYGARALSHDGAPLPVSQGQAVRDLEIKLTPQSVITGTVFDEAGDPIPNVDVAAVRRIGYGSRRTAGAGEATTNDRGEFRIFDLWPGTYLLAARPVNSSQAPALRIQAGRPAEQLVPTYYPGVTDLAGAAAVEVGAGQEVSGRDIQMRREPVVRVRGRLAPLTPGVSLRNVRVGLAPRDRQESGSWLRDANRVPGPDGAFEIGGVRPGSYYVLAVRTEGRAHIAGRLPVEVGPSDLTDLLLPVGEALTVSGVVRVESRNRVRLDGVRVSLALSDATPTAAQPNAAVQENGAFRLDGVSRDAFRFLFQNLPEGLYVKSVRVGGQDILEKGLDLSQSNAAPQLEIVLSAGAGAVEGTARVEDKPASDGYITLIPEPMNPNRLFRYRAVPVDHTGRFRIAGVAPGDYRIYAWEEQEMAPAAEAELPPAVTGKGVKVTVREGGREAVDLTVILPDNLASGSR